DDGAGHALVGAGRARLFETTDTLAITGGNDTILVTGDGNNTILGGMGADTIRTKNNTTTAGVIGTDILLGDNGLVERDAEGNNLKLIATKSQASTGGGIVDLGGDDIIEALDGTKIALGGDGADRIDLGVASAITNTHTVIGDNGSITYVAMDQTGEGKALRYETSDTISVGTVLIPATGGVDLITTGNGDN